MKKAVVLGFALLAAVTLSASSAMAADPSLREVYQAAETGHLKQAEAMMDQVLRDHPNSAKAHFVEAELLAKEGRVDMARAELTTAERLAPGLPGIKTESVQVLNRQLNPPARTAPIAAPSHSPVAAAEFPWGLLLLGLGFIVAVVFFVRSLNRSRGQALGGASYIPAGNNFGGPYAQPAGVGGMGPVGPAGGGIGSGILGGLATGAAVGAGMVAGEALMHKMFDGGGNRVVDSSALQPFDSPPASDANIGMGGNDFGVADSGSWDDAGSGGGSDDWS